MGFLNRIASILTQFVNPVYVLRAPIFAATVAAILLAVPDQTLEIYRALALDRAAYFAQIILAIVTLALGGAVIWYIGRNLTLRWQREDLTASSVSGFLLRWMPRLLGAMPLFAAAIGMSKAADSFRPIAVPGWVEAQMPAVVELITTAAAEHTTARRLLWSAAAIVVGLGVLLIFFTFMRSFRKRWKYEDPNPWLFGLPIRLGFYALTALLVFAFSAFFIGNPAEYGLLSENLGTFAIFNLFFISLAFFTSALTNVYDRTRLPALSLLAVLAIGSTALDFNDNHEIRTTKRAFLPLPSAATSFRDWVESRPDRAYFQGRGEPYPVYVVAAQGGGLYAAQHVATTLARMQDRCPGFAQHVFTISGVSGGSLGAALFSALAKERAKPIAEPTCTFGEQKPGWFEERTIAFMRKDFMSPLAAAGLFPDFLQRFIPWPFPEFDRARALEAAFEKAWADAVPDIAGNAFSESFYRHWTPEGTAPSLVLNATNVQTGVRVAIAPYRFFRQSTVRLPTLNSIIRADLPLSTAVGISARFPWILPPASWRRGSEQYRFVDGGYFESSGIDTALDLVSLIEDSMKQLREDKGIDLNVKLQLLILSTDDILEDPVSTRNSSELRLEDTDRDGFDEVAAPIETMLKTRWQRGVVSVARAFDKFCDDCFRDRLDRRIYAGIDGDARMFRLNFTDISFTLGWQLSAASRTLVSAHSGYPDRCLGARRSLRERWPWIARVLNENNCAACQMMYTLTGRTKDLDKIAPSITRQSGPVRAELPTWVQLCRATAGDDRQPAYNAAPLSNPQTPAPLQ